MKLLMIAGVILMMAAQAPAQQVKPLGEGKEAAEEFPVLPSGLIPPLADLEAAAAKPASASATAPAKAEVVKSTAAVKAEKKPVAVKITAAAVAKSTAAAVAPKAPQPKTAAVPASEKSAQVPVKPAAATGAAPAASAPIVIKPSVSMSTEKQNMASPAASKPETAKPASLKPEPKAETVKPAAPPATEAKKEPVKPAVPAAPPSTVTNEGGFVVTKKHSVVKGETLWDLSGKYYGDPFKWGKIYNANMASIEDPDRIYPDEEIMIPEITETVKPAPKPEIIADMEVPAAEEHAALLPENAAEEPAGEEPAPAVEAPAPAPALPEPPAEKAPAYDLAYLSDEMPEDMKEWTPGAAVVVPENWKADGRVLSRSGSADPWATLAAPGDKVRLKVRDPASFRPGQVITSYKKGAPARDRKTNKKLGLELQKTGSLEVMSVSKNIVIGRIIEANTSIDEGQVIKTGK